MSVVLTTIPDSTWLILLIWLGLLVMGLREKYYGAIGAIIGVLFGLLLMTDVSQWLGLVLIFLNIYIFYRSLFTEAEGK